MAFVHNGFLMRPGDKGTWAMSGAIGNKGTYVDVCAECSSGVGNDVNRRTGYVSD